MYHDTKTSLVSSDSDGTGSTGSPKVQVQIHITRQIVRHTSSADPRNSQESPTVWGRVYAGLPDDECSAPLHNGAKPWSEYPAEDSEEYRSVDEEQSVAPSRARDGLLLARKRPTLRLDTLMSHVRRIHTSCDSARTDDSMTSPASCASASSATSLNTVFPPKPYNWLRRVVVAYRALYP